MNRKVVQFALIFVAVMLFMQVAGVRQIDVLPVVAQNGADLYIKDTPADTGVEPNPDMGPMWVTEDIWVRRSPDPSYQPYPFAEGSPPWTPLPHQNPEYRDPKFSLPNYVYVRVRNRGSAPSTGSERLRLYWAKASTGLAWPAQWVDYLAMSGGSLELFGAEVTKPRKNAATATAAERNAYRDAILAIGTPSFLFPGGLSYWHKQDQVHQFGPSNRHGSPAFLPWHREFINRYEVLLQEADPTVRLLYWDWTTDPENSTGGFNFFTAGFMGASGRGTGGTSIGLPFIPALSPPAVTRNLNVSTIPPANTDISLLTNGTYQLFAPDLETSPNHDSSHGYIGGGGNMSFISQAAEDPFFFLLHTNADRLWAQWQRNPANLSRLAPSTAYDGDSGNVNITTVMRPWDGTGTSIQPWTVADGYIVSKSPQHPSIVSPPIYDTAPLVIPILQPGEAVVIEIPWYPPNPADFAAFGGDQGHFCLLGRIETATTAPFGMTFAEGMDVNANTRNNNNIAWKNITVVDDFSGALGLSSILIHNIFREAVSAGLRFADTELIGGSFFDFGTIVVDLKPELYDRWIAGGAVGQGVEAIGENMIQIFSSDASIQNIRLEPGEMFAVDVHFELFEKYELPRGGLPKWDLIQTGAPGNPEALVGGQRFEMDFSKLVLVGDGSEWRYLDDGSYPGDEWLSPDFDDTEWKSGQAELGFGDNPVTTIEGGPPDSRHITAYFRRSFDVADPSFFHTLLLRLKRDDGAVVYLNGTEIHRVNLPDGDVGPETPATREVDGLEEEMFFPILPVGLDLLKAGPNTIAVEIHQDSPGSPDLSFDLELAANPARTQFPPAVAFVAPPDGALFQVGQAILIEVEALDSDGEITAVSLFAGDTPLGSDDQPPFTFEWTDAPLGIHLLHAETRDNSGEQATADLTINVVENVPPIVELVAPLDGASFMAGETIRLVAKASDPGGSVTSVEFYARDGDLFAAAEQLVGTADESPYTFDLTGLDPGHYMFTAQARDDRGATSQGMPIHITVEHDHRQPMVFLPAVHR